MGKQVTIEKVEGGFILNWSHDYESVTPAASLRTCTGTEVHTTTAAVLESAKYHLD